MLYRIVLYCMLRMNRPKKLKTHLKHSLRNSSTESNEDPSGIGLFLRNKIHIILLLRKRRRIKEHGGKGLSHI